MSDKLILCNSVEGNSLFHHGSFFGSSFLFEDIETHQGVWQAQTAHQSIKENEFGDYIFAYATDISGKTTTELEDGPEVNCVTVFVRTINGKTTSIKCDKKQNSTGETGKKNIDPSRCNQPRRPLYDKKTKEEDSIGAEATIEMSMRILRGMEK